MFRLAFDTDNAAFEDRKCFEVRRILLRVADKVEAGHKDGAILDLNGNQVGSWTLD